MESQKFLGYFTDVLYKESLNLEWTLQEYTGCVFLTASCSWKYDYRAKRLSRMTLVQELMTVIKMSVSLFIIQMAVTTPEKRK